MSKRVILFLVLVLSGLSVQADYTVTTQKPFYNAQAAGCYPYAQTYNQQYNQGYYQNPYQQQYYNPYLYRRPYIVNGNNLPTIVTNTADTTTTTSVPRQVARNVGQAMMFRMLRGY